MGGFFLRLYSNKVRDLDPVAFVRKKVKTFKWPVNVEEPADGGIFETSTFDATFKRLGRAEFSKLSNKGDFDLLKAVLIALVFQAEQQGRL